MSMKLVDDRSDPQKTLQKSEIPERPEGYYSGDKPNPNMRKFIEDHLREHPYNPADDSYNVPAFDKPIETTKGSTIFNMHTYWSKKPHDAIRQYIQHYTIKGDIVLDPFCGSGSTAFAALIDGRSAIAIDRSPAATFITKNYCTPTNVRALKFAFEKLQEKIKPEMDWLYQTKCDRCGGKATIIYTVYSQVFQCPRCLEKIPLFSCDKAEVPMKTKKEGESQKMKIVNICPHCNKSGHTEVIRSQSQKFGTVPVLVNYICENGCKPARDERRYNDKNAKKREFFEKFDLKKIEEIEKLPIPYWYPKECDMTSFSRYQRDALFYYGVKEAADFYTKRNLWALSIICNYSKQIKELYDPLMFSLTSIMFSVSRMYLWTEDNQHGIISGTYYLPQICREINVWTQFPDKINTLIKLQDFMPKFGNLMISTSSATMMDLPSNSIDYIFTDPPYAGKFQYGELNFIWECWLNFNTNWLSEEITINETRKIHEEDWIKKMEIAMQECYRVLKPGHWISLCYHDTSEGSWGLIQDIMANAGFIVDTSGSAVYLDSIKKTFNQYNADKVTKRDLVINFRKPRTEEITGIFTITGDEDVTTFSQKVVDIIRDYLTIHPGTTKDRIYDEVVSRMVRAGQMEAHNFEDLLKRIAEPVANEGSISVGARWYLKETELNAVDTAETNKEDAASEKVESFINDYLQKNPEQEGVHYSNIFENFIYAVKDKPRRPLAEWLLDYFYKTGEGTYRLPISEAERQVKKEGRAKGIARKIKHYIVHLEQNIPLSTKIRPSDATIAEWIHHCRRAGMHEQGKILYEKGGIRLDALSEEQQATVEEDYDVCARMIARGIDQPAAQPKKGRKKKDILTI